MRVRLISAAAAALSTLLLAAALPLAASAQESASANLGPVDQKVSPILLAELRNIAKESLKQTPHFGQVPLKAIEDKQAPAGSQPLVLYIGADYCPFCAGVRWPLVLALMRFGDLSDLRYTRSATRDVFPDTATFSFVDASYKSDYIRLEAVEIQDRNGKPLEKPTAAQRETFTRYNDQGSIPFIYLGGRYVEIGAPFSPGVFKGMDWQQVAQQLGQGGNAAWQDVVSAADVLTAGICELTKGEPADVCKAPGVAAATARLPK